jgi:transcriptional regulator with XRE-family HTH domain
MTSNYGIMAKKEARMYKTDQVERLQSKNTLHAIQVELQQGYNLSPVEAQVLARRVRQLVDEQLGLTRQAGQVTYQAIALDEPPGKPLRMCRKVAIHLTMITDEDSKLWGEGGAEFIRRERVRRWVYEALLQGGALTQEDLACLLGVSRKTVQRIFAWYREQGQRLPSRGEIQDMGRGVSHKIPVIRRYVQDLSFTKIADELGNHGIDSMARYLRHFALVMVLTERGLTAEQMQSVVGISANLVEQYQELYEELNHPEHQRTLQRLQRVVLSPVTTTDPSKEAQKSLKRGSE